MTSTDHPSGLPPTEGDIQAYADGTLTPERAAALRDYLGKHPAEARRVAFYDRLNAQIQATFQTTDEPAHGHLGGSRRLRRRPHPAGRGRRTLIALVTLALLLIAVSGWLAATQVSAQALDNAAVMALAEATARPFSSASPTRADPAAPDLGAIGLRLVEQRVLRLGPLQRADELVYLNGDQQPVVVLSAMAPFARDEPQWAARRIGELRLLTWTAQRQRFVVAGNARTHGLMRAADVMTAR
ncbi:transcriptional regulator [Paraburkholderia sp. UYCP14C]|uniref:anti-sigma factor family protein n=1 Tax=Paraburkholderia sp. UYCP14C TaxID=2511130 RepID=UPI00102271C3|nr:transcriptional regulator [Paraburkholderia sp. UYCP14C]RZF24760.1 transcriptional regulator [Paraburkholderia sp. UYCP14C]